MEEIIKLPDFAENALGVHILLDLEGCNATILKDLKRIRRAMLKAAKLAKATIIKSGFQDFGPGVSGMVIIAESHLSIHTWPEHGAAAVDVFTCGDLGCDKAANYLYETLQAKSYSVDIKLRLISKDARPHKINLE